MKMVKRASRRTFLTGLAGGLTLLPLASKSLKATKFDADTELLGHVTDASETWDALRHEFAFGEEKIPMNAANLCPSPRVVADRVSELTHDIDMDCSFNNRAKFNGLLEESRRKVADQVGATEDEIALVRNTSEANNIVNNGLSLKAGDEIVLWDQNHTTNNIAWDVRVARYNLEGTSNLVVKRVTTPKHPRSMEELAQVFIDALTPQTRVLALTHVSNLSGVRLPIKELCEVAHSRGIYVHVDGAQSWGALDLNLHELGCDSFTASAHKWFMGPKEVGLLYVRADRVPRIWPNVVAPGWGDDTDPDVKGARKFESMGQRDDSALAAIGTTADFHKRFGSDRIEARMIEIATALKQGLKESGFSLVTPLDPALSGGVCIIEAPVDKRAEALDRLYDEHGVFGAAAGGVRLSPHVYNTMAHVDRAIEGMRSLRSLLT